MLDKIKKHIIIVVMSKKKSKKVAFRTIYYYWQEIKRYKWYSLGLLILTPTVIFIRNVLGAYIFADIIGKISAGIPENEVIPTLLPEIIIYIVTFLLNSLVFEKLRLYLCWKMELKAMYNLNIKVFETVCAQSMQFHNDRFSGSLVSQTNKFVDSFERLADMVIWNLMPILTYTISTVIIVWQRTPIFALALIGTVIIYTIFTAFSFKKIRTLNENEAAAYNKKTGQLADSISNVISVKSYAKESHEQRRYADFQRKAMNASFATMRATITRDYLFSSIIIVLTIALLVFLVGGSTWFGLSVSTLILLVNYSQTLLGNLYDITHIFKDINRCFGDAYDMTEILDMADDVVDEKGAKTLNLEKGEIIFNNVTFKHKDAKDTIFENFSLAIKPGERVGLVGISGSGKTTLTKLLLRFANVDAGEILIDGQDIRYVTQNSLRKNIAYVPQETALFHRSISDNIAYSKPDTDQSEIEKVAKLAHVDEFVNKLPDGYNTLVGERGIKLSGGQRQRIAIARAMLKDAPILVLDEATSALDSESEALIQEALNNLMKGRTAIVVAHRLSTIANLDRIVVLKDGIITEQGTHKELLKKNGAYAKLWSRQSGAFLDSKD